LYFRGRQTDYQVLQVTRATWNGGTGAVKRTIEPFVRGAHVGPHLYVGNRRGEDVSIIDLPERGERSRDTNIEQQYQRAN